MHQLIPALALVFYVALISNPEHVNAAEPVQGEPAKLAIGEEAPPLNIQHWHTSSVFPSDTEFEFKQGHIYIVEFWATWCGPCVTQMPIMAALQKSFKDDNVHLVSVSEEEREVIDDFLSRSVPNKKGMTYRQLASHYAICSDPDGSVFRDYMTALGETRVPKALIVGASGKVEWIGNPARIERPLKAVVKGTWDVQAFKKHYASQQRLNHALQEIAGFRRQNADQELLVKELDRRIAEAESTSKDAPILVEDPQILIETLRGMRLATLFRLGRTDEVSLDLQTAFSGTGSDRVRAINMANMLVQLPPTLDIDHKSLAEAAIERLRDPSEKAQAGNAQLSFREHAELGRPLVLARLYRMLERDDEAVKVLNKTRETCDLIFVRDSIDRLLDEIENEKSE